MPDELKKRLRDFNSLGVVIVIQLWVVIIILAFILGRMKG